MLEHTREMLAVFYPETDGLFIESSDYSICHCADCDARHFDHEFKFIPRSQCEALGAQAQGRNCVSAGRQALPRKLMAGRDGSGTVRSAAQ